MKILKDALTGVDNTTYDIVRLGILAGMLTFCGLAIASYAKFDPQAFGMGFAAIVAGGGGALALKAKTEPSAGKAD